MLNIFSIIPKLLAIIFYVGFVIFLFKSQFSQRITPYFYFLNVQIFSLVSLIMIESGFWIQEQNRWGFSNGAFWLYLTFCFVALAGYILGAASLSIQSITYHMRTSSRNEFVLMSLGMVFFLFFFGYATIRAAGVAGLHNHNFLLYTYPVWVIPFMDTAMNALGWYGIFRIDEMRKKLIFAALYVVDLKLAGGLFGGIVVIGLILFFSTTLVKRVKLAHLFSSAIIVLSIASLIKIYSQVGYGLPWWTLITDRLAEQAHVFWYGVNIWVAGKSVNLGLVAWLSNYFHFHYDLNDQYSVGRVMASIAPTEAQIFFANDTAFATDLQGIMLMGPGLVPALGLVFLGAFLFPKVFFFLIRLARERSYIAFLLYFRLFELFVLKFYFDGDFGFLNIKITGYIVLLLFILSLKNDYRKWFRGGSPYLSRKPQHLR